MILVPLYLFTLQLTHIVRFCAQQVNFAKFEDKCLPTLCTSWWIIEWLCVNLLLLLPACPPARGQVPAREDMCLPGCPLHLLTNGKVFCKCCKDKCLPGCLLSTCLPSPLHLATAVTWSSLTAAWQWQVPKSAVTWSSLTAAWQWQVPKSPVVDHLSNKIGSPQLSN